MSAIKQPTDSCTRLETLKEAIRRFVAERAWEKYHTPKNLAVSVAVEAGELLEIYQWAQGASPTDISRTSAQYEQTVEELADVFIYCLMLAMSLDIDVTTAVLSKIDANRTKYPASDVTGMYRRPSENKDRGA